MTNATDDLLRLIIDSAEDFAIFTIDPNGMATSWSRGAERVLGFTDAEMIGRSTDVTFPADEGGANAGAEERRAALAHGRAEDERWQQRKDGTRFWASGLLLPLTDPSRGFVKILRDRTQQHQLEERLRASEELFRVLATHIPQLVFRSRASGDRTWGSPQWTMYTGISFDESLQLGWMDAVHPDDREATQQAWDQAAANEEYYVEHRLRRGADAEYRWHQTRAVPLRHVPAAADEWIGTSTDIHNLRMLQDEQQVLLAELQHRTRNLLGLVQGVANQTLRSSSSLDEFGEKFGSRLRALSRVQRLLARVGHQTISVRELVETELLAHGSDGGKVRVEGPSCILPPPAAQPLALAIHELATNAVKYGALSKEGAQLHVTWANDDSSNEPRIVLRWRESGVKTTGPATSRTGYGFELIERALPYQLGAETHLDLGTDGLTCEIRVPLAPRRSS